MPEGDTIHYAANRIRAALVGEEIEEIATPHPRHRADRWPERLQGRAVRRVDAHGKHLFVRFDGDLTLHSHLRMTGQWGIYRRGQRWRRSPRRAWLVIRTPEHEVVEFDGPVLELMADSRTRFDQRIASLGPDLIADDFDERAYLRRLRESDPTRGIGEAVLDQRIVAGIGNIWKCESCFLARIDPWRKVGELSDEEALAIVRGARPLMRASARIGIRAHSAEPSACGEGGRITTAPGGRVWVHERAGLPCRRCGTLVRGRGQGDDNRTTFWCPSCQA